MMNRDQIAPSTSSFAVCLAIIHSVVAGQPIPPPSPLSPADGAVYSIGEPVLIETEFLGGCIFGQPAATTSRIVRNRSIPMSLVSREGADEVIRLSTPGDYEIERQCVTGAATGTVYRNLITVVSDCPTTFPLPVTSGAIPQEPILSVRQYTTVSGARQVLTLDNTFDALAALEIKNEGSADLVLLDITPYCDFESFKVTVEGFSRYTVVRPGHTFYAELSGQITAPSIMSQCQREQYVFVIQSNDPTSPVIYFQIVFESFPTQDDIPSHYVFSDPPPANPATPECADQNSDGTVDAADVVNFVLSR
jgi:hypothetical protein